MRQTLRVLGAAIVLVGALSACGTESGDSTATDPGPDTSSAPPSGSTSDSPSPSSTEPSREDAVRLRIGEASTTSAQIVSATNGGGELTPRAAALPTPAAVDDFVGQLDPALGEQVRAAAGRVSVPEGTDLFASVVAIGCDEPTAVTVTRTFEGLETSASMPKKGVQCFAPVTYVALFLSARTA